MLCIEERCDTRRKTKKDTARLELVDGLEVTPYFADAGSWEHCSPAKGYCNCEFRVWSTCLPATQQQWRHDLEKLNSATAVPCAALIWIGTPL